MPRKKIDPEPAVYVLASVLEDLDRLKPYSMNSDFRYFVEGAAERLGLGADDYDKQAVIEMRRAEVRAGRNRI